MRNWVKIIILASVGSTSCKAAEDIRETSVYSGDGGRSSASTSSSVSEYPLCEDEELIDLFDHRLTLDGSHVTLDESHGKEALVRSLSMYQGVESNQIADIIAQRFPRSKRIRIGIVGGWTESGLGQMNLGLSPETQPFYLINIEKGKGVSYAMNWAQHTLPSSLHNQFHILILEQIESDNLIFSKTYQNAFLALKPGGFVYFNTYRPSDYYINCANLLMSNDRERILECPYLKEFYDKINCKEGKSWGHLIEFFTKYLKDAGFDKVAYECANSLKSSSLFINSPLIIDSPYYEKIDYCSGGWCAGVKSFKS